MWKIEITGHQECEVEAEKGNAPKNCLWLKKAYYTINMSHLGELGRRLSKHRAETEQLRHTWSYSEKEHTGGG